MGDGNPKERRKIMKHVLGEGILNWNTGERQTDRYGSVMLTRIPMNNPLGEKLGYTSLDEKFEGKHGSLTATVTLNRLSPHIGDLFRGLYPPKTPTPIGTELLLGIGTVFFEDNREGGPCVGLSPDDGRQNDWLDPEVLYKLHNQTVVLFFEDEEG
jgi:hypothetical protein